MRNIKYLLSFLMLCNLAFAEEGNVSGEWAGSWQYSDKSYTEKMIFTLVQNGTNISGTAIDELGVNADIEGTLLNNEFEVILTPNNQTDPITFNGIVTRNKISGLWHLEELSGPWTVTKSM